MTAEPAHSMNSADGAVLGSTTPRLWTPPLRELTPETSYGFDVIDFARDVLDSPLDEWEQWAAIHLGELLPDGRPRFRKMLILVARQNGKSLLVKMLILYWLFVELVPLVLGTSTDRTYAKRAWSDICETAKENGWLKRKLGPGAIRLTIGEESLTTSDDAEYIFAANNRRAGRSTTLHRWACDELREHRDWTAWNAASKAMNAVPGAQIVAVTNQGDDTSVVLDSLRKSAITYIETGQGDPRLGLLEWSSPDGADPTDLHALAQANPNLGRRVDPDALLGDAITAVANGGDELAGFKTESMCMRVHQLDPAIDPERWADGGTDAPISLAEHRQQTALVFDVSLDGGHASLLAAAVVDGVANAEVIEQWDGFGCTAKLRRDLPAIVRKVKPRVVGWLPNGPAAAIAADLGKRAGWLPRGVELVEIKAEVPAVCMGLADIVLAGELRHPNDPMLNQHVLSAQRLWIGDKWVYTRKGGSAVDGTYALAGAVHLARTLPPPPPPLTIVSARR